MVKSRRQQAVEETLRSTSGESRAVIEALLHVVAALKSQPGFDAEAFDAEMNSRMKEVPDDMNVAVLILSAAASLPRKAQPARRPRTLPSRYTSLLKQ